MGQVLGTRTQIIVLLFFTYIYDLVRNGYFVSRAKQYQLLSQSGPPPETGAGPPASRRSLAGKGSSPSTVFACPLWPGPARAPSDEPHQCGTTSSPSQANNNSNNSAWNQDDCPLAEMPRLLRYYFYLSHVFIATIFIKLTIVGCIQFRWLAVRPHYACYLPGRLAFMSDYIFEQPSVSWVIVFYHVIFRYYLCVRCKQFSLDCFLFMLTPRETVLAKAAALRDLQRRPHSIEARKLYLKDSMFYYRINLTGRRITFGLKSYRTLEHWLKLRWILKHLVIGSLLSFVVWCAPLALAIVNNLASHEYFKENYPDCGSFSSHSRPPATGADDQQMAPEWSFSDPYRRIATAFDLIDNSLLLLNTSAGLVWPFVTAIVCCEDIAMSVEQLCRRVDRAAETLAVDAAAGRRDSSRSLETEILAVQSESVQVFNQIALVDKFISAFAAFCVFAWVFINLFYEIVAMIKKRLLLPNMIIVYMQLLGFVALTITFTLMGRAFLRTTTLYYRMCNLAALDPFHKTTKPGWIWIFEYFFHSNKRRSLHIGPSAELSVANYLKCMTWFISCALVLMNLLKFKLEGV